MPQNVHYVKMLGSEFHIRDKSVAHYEEEQIIQVLRQVVEGRKIAEVGAKALRTKSSLNRGCRADLSSLEGQVRALTYCLSPTPQVIPRGRDARYTCAQSRTTECAMT